MCELVLLRGIATRIDGELMAENYKVNMWNRSHTVDLAAANQLSTEHTGAA